MIHAELLGHCLQLAVPVGDTDGADMVAFGKQEFEDCASITVEPFRASAHFHAFLDFGHTGREQLVDPFHFNQTKAASPNI
jgi:hypothetical protein